MGINPDKVIAMTFVIGSALAGVAGVLVGTYYQSVSPNIGMMYGLKAGHLCLLKALPYLKVS